MRDAVDNSLGDGGGHEITAYGRASIARSVPCATSEAGPRPAIADREAVEQFSRRTTGRSRRRFLRS
jgi:hypothetical protein